MDVGQIAAQLADRAEEIARMLLPAGKKVGNEWCVGSTDGEQGSSLQVHLTGSKSGVWKDFAGGPGGDLIDLWRHVRGISLPDAVRAAKGYLGITDPDLSASKTRSYTRPKRPKCERPTNGVLAYLRDERRISPEAIAAYQVAETKDAKGAIIIFPFKRDEELVNLKYLRVERTAGKKESWSTKGCEMILWGWQVIPPSSRTVLICEGEIDALTWFDYGHPALSVPNGAKSLIWLESEYHHLERFDTIYLSFDMDGPGREGLAELIDRLGRHRCRNIKLPYKDANECLQQGVTREQIELCLAQSETCDPAELRRASSYTDAVIECFYPSTEKNKGMATPWLQIRDDLRFRPAELTLWTGVTGHGKTSILSYVINHIVLQGEKSMIASFEMKAGPLLKKMIRQLTAERSPAIKTIERGMSWYDGKLWIYDLVGTAKTKPLLDGMRYARERYGITHFVIDSLMRCGIDEDDYNAQTRFVNELAEFATTHNVHVHLVAHPRKKSDDKDAVGVLDIKGSSSISNLAFNVLIVWKNKEKLREVSAARSENRQPNAQMMERPDAVLICDKQREGEWEDQIGLWFDQDSMQFLEHPDQSPVNYLAAANAHVEVEEWWQ